MLTQRAARRQHHDASDVDNVRLFLSASQILHGLLAEVMGCKEEMCTRGRGVDLDGARDIVVGTGWLLLSVVNDQVIREDVIAGRYLLALV